MIEITEIYPPIGPVMSRNPIFVRISADELVTYRVGIGDGVVYTGNATGDFVINLSELADSYSETPTIEVEDSLLLPINNAPKSLDVGVYAASRLYVTLSFLVFKGGISRADFRALYNLGTDVFSDRFRNYGGNFFFTTRSSGWQIVLKETELEPLPFLMPPGGVVWVRDEASWEETGFSLPVAGTPDGFGALNIEAVRHKFFNRFGIIPSILGIATDEHANQPSCMIIIEQADTAQERHTVRFLSSLGVFERIDMAGILTVSTALQQEENITARHYDRVTDSFLYSRERCEVSDIYKLTVTTRCSYEQQLLTDMITSDCVYLETDAGWLRVIPSCENIGHAVRQREPEQLTITFRAVEDRKNITPQRSEEGSVRPRIFSDEFTEQFI